LITAVDHFSDGAGQALMAAMMVAAVVAGARRERL
jgi:hypothetical protein